MSRSLLLKLVFLGVVVGVGHLFFIQFCDLLFDCGCRALWAGAASHCNIHNPGPPHCPWCLQEGSFGWWSFVAVITSQAAIVLWPGALGPGRVISALLAFPVVGGLAGGAIGVATGYWA